MSPGSGWLGTISEQWSSRSNCNPKLAKSSASPAPEPRTDAGTMKRAMSWNALPPGFAPAGWTSGHWKPCWMKSLNYHLIRWCFTYRCCATELESRSRRLRWPDSSLKLPECRSTVSPGPNLNKESLAELCWIFRRSAIRPPHSPSVYSRGRGRQRSRYRTRRSIHCSLTGVHSKNGTSPRAEFPRKPRCYIGTQTCGIQHPRLILATAAVVGLQSVLIVGLIVQRSRRKRAEEALRESEQHMGLAASAAELAMWTWDIQRDQIWMTDKGRALFGYRAGNAPGLRGA